eukprot:6043030-Amphidinium_carterae.1
MTTKTDKVSCCTIPLCERRTIYSGRLTKLVRVPEVVELTASVTTFNRHAQELVNKRLTKHNSKHFK